MKKVTPDVSNVTSLEPAAPLAHPQDLQQLTDDLNSVIVRLQLFFAIEEMTDAERRRLRATASGVRRYGFIDKTSDLAEAFPQYSPAMFDVAKLKDKIRDIEYLRNLITAAGELIRLASAALALESDAAYKLALRYYASVKQLARQGEQGAQAVYRVLELFFKSMTRKAGEEPSDHKLESDFRALLHGRRDGRIEIQATTPHAEQRVREVIDQTHRPALERETIKIEDETAR